MKQVRGSGNRSRPKFPLVTGCPREISRPGIGLDPAPAAAPNRALPVVIGSISEPSTSIYFYCIIKWHGWRRYVVGLTLFFFFFF